MKTTVMRLSELSEEIYRCRQNLRRLVTEKARADARAKLKALIAERDSLNGEQYAKRKRGV